MSHTLYIAAMFASTREPHTTLYDMYKTVQGCLVMRLYTRIWLWSASDRVTRGDVFTAVVHSYQSTHSSALLPPMIPTIFAMMDGIMLHARVFTPNSPTCARMRVLRQFARGGGTHDECATPRVCVCVCDFSAQSGAATSRCLNACTANVEWSDSRIYLPAYSCKCISLLRARAQSIARRYVNRANASGVVVVARRCSMLIPCIYWQASWYGGACDYLANKL